MNEATPADVLRDVATPADVLKLLRPHLRKVVEAGDPAFLGAFDAAYDDAAADAVEEIRDGLSHMDSLSGEQAGGLNSFVQNNIAAFVINVAASIAVAHFEARHPDVWSWLISIPSAEAAAPADAEPAVRLLNRLRLPDEDCGKALAQVRSDPLLTHVLASTGLP